MIIFFPARLYMKEINLFCYLKSRHILFSQNMLMYTCSGLLVFVFITLCINGIKRLTLTVKMGILSSISEKPSGMSTESS